MGQKLEGEQFGSPSQSDNKGHRGDSDVGTSAATAPEASFLYTKVRVPSFEREVKYDRTCEGA